MKKAVLMTLTIMYTFTPAVFSQNLPVLDYGTQYNNTYDVPSYHYSPTYSNGNYQQAGYGYNQNLAYPVQHYYDQNEGIKRKAVTLGKGAAVGAAAGTIYGLIAGKNPGKYALIGTAAGAGTAAINTNKRLGNHSLVKSVALGAVLGTAASFAASKNDRNIYKGALLGAGLGAGFNYLKDRYGY